MNSGVHRLIVHPGFLKTATTTLQKHLFSSHPALFSVGLPHRSPVQARLAEELRRIEGVDYDEEQLRVLIQQAVAEQIPGSVAILSDEALTGNAYLLEPIACRLRDFFPGAHVLFTIRHQFDSIRSFYARHGRVLTNVPAPYADRHITFADWLTHAYQNLPTSYLGLVDYRRTIKIYEQIFGRERIHILLFEDLKHDRKTFVDQLAEVLSVDPSTIHPLLNGRQTHSQQSMRFVFCDRFMKRFAPESWLRPGGSLTAHLPGWLKAFLGGGRPNRVDIPRVWIPRLEEIYRTGNRTLAERYDLRLQEYGYP